MIFLPLQIQSNTTPKIDGKIPYAVRSKIRISTKFLSKGNRLIGEIPGMKKRDVTNPRIMKIVKIMLASLAFWIFCKGHQTSFYGGFAGVSGLTSLTPDFK